MGVMMGRGLRLTEEEAARMGLISPLPQKVATKEPPLVSRATVWIISMIIAWFIGWSMGLMMAK